MDATTQQPESSKHEGRLARFSRTHPVLTFGGLAAVGLLGGVELAAGLLAGAGVATLLRRPSSPFVESESPPQPETRMHELRRRFEERARAVVSAARGEAVVPGH